MWVGREERRVEWCLEDEGPSTAGCEDGGMRRVGFCERCKTIRMIVIDEGRGDWHVKWEQGCGMPLLSLAVSVLCRPYRLNIGAKRESFGTRMSLFRWNG